MGIDDADKKSMDTFNEKGAGVARREGKIIIL
jgi:hypothetical protein